MWFCPTMQVHKLCNPALTCARSGHLRSQPLGHPAWRGAGAAGGAPRAHGHRQKVRCGMCRNVRGCHSYKPAVQHLSTQQSQQSQQSAQHSSALSARVAAARSGTPLRTTWRSPLRRELSTGGASTTRVCRCAPHHASHTRIHGHAQPCCVLAIADTVLSSSPVSCALPAPASICAHTCCWAPVTLSLR